MHLWHTRVHEKFGEQLAYFQLQFAPVYQRQRIWKLLTETLEDHKICSYCIYETYGIYDIMLRAWLPSGVVPAHFVRILFETLCPASCTRVLPFFVTNAYHWAWLSPDGQTFHLPSSACLDRLTYQEVRRIDDPSGDDGREAEIGTLTADHLLRSYDTDKEGVKFFVIIPPPMPAFLPSRQQEEALTEAIRHQLQTFQNNRYITQPSLYLGTGFAWLLIKGKVLLTSQISHIGDLIDEINKLGSAGIQGLNLRTYTYVSTGQAEEKESISLRLGPVQESSAEARFFDIDTIDNYLVRGESERFEVKASFRLDVGAYVFNRSRAQGVGEAKDALVSEVLETVVAFLNSQGGILLIGALEKAKFAAELARPGSRLAGLPQSGDWIVCGINWEYALLKNPDFDAFRLKVLDYVRDRIGSGASALISLQRVEYKGHDVAVITVPKGFEWYYLDNKYFFVRRSGSNLPLEGRERAAYQKTRP